MSRLLALGVVVALALAAAAAHADTHPPTGELVAEHDGRRISLPLLSMTVHADVLGDLATVEVTQRFVNPTETPLHGRYQFPLNRTAAVFEMEMVVGDERVRARIDRVEVARQRFETARREGRAAALLEQHRPNLFTQDVAHLMPDQPITVRLRYVQTVPKQDGAYQLVVPLVVGPRYRPRTLSHPLDAGNPATVTADGWRIGATDRIPAVAGHDLPSDAVGPRVTATARIAAGMPIVALDSPSHRITVTRPSESEDADPTATAAPAPARGEIAEVRLTDGQIADDRDLVLRYVLSAPETQAGLLAHRDRRGGFFSLLIEPPAVPAEAEISPRELVFVLDCSGSMHGLPIEASKAFMRAALSNLRASDHFRLIRFSDRATEFGRSALAATPANIARGLAYIDQLVGSGGTEMTSGIRQALAGTPPTGAVRLVVFLTDGYIGNDHEVIALVQRRLGAARLYAFGVGTSVNRFLLAAMARAGRGFVRVMDPTEPVDEVARALAARIDAPVLTDLAIDWGDAPIAAATPDPIPDLFAGGAVRVTGRYSQPGTHRIAIRGRSPQGPAELPLTVTLPATSGPDSDAVALIWARSTIADRMHRLTAVVPTDDAAETVRDRLQAEVTQLGLDYSLVTRWTSFVAVSERIVNADPAGTATRQVPLPRVAGVGPTAYGPAGAGPGGFKGQATPEPGTGAALLALAGGAFVWLRRRRARAAG